MSEDNTHRTRQIHHALRFRELVTHLTLTFRELDPKTLDHGAIARIEQLMTELDSDADLIARSTYKLLD
ncbi:MAG TPA: hypothetical protein VKW06_10325 [Candidatus Angelobacter sp.]|nr:hypothetical protein [Candidatus Angelobacter sp.]